MKRATFFSGTLLAFAMVGCSPGGAGSPAPAATASPPATIPGLPVSLRVTQRSTTTVPGAMDELSLTIDDITRGQVMVSLIGKDSEPLYGPVSMKDGDEASFRFGETDYRLRLAELENSLVGDDFATFEISAAGSTSLTESQKIERLIAAVESLEAVFIRNGVEHSAVDAAAHLRRKLDAAGGAVTTAELFIEHIGSRSSTTGDEYQIRFKDGRAVPAGEFLRGDLAKLTGGEPRTE